MRYTIHTWQCMGLCQQHCVGSHTSCQFLFDRHVLGRGYLWALAGTFTLLSNPSCVAYLDTERPSFLADLLYTSHLQKFKCTTNKPAPDAMKQQCVHALWLCRTRQLSILYLGMLLLPMQAACPIWHQRCSWFQSQRTPSPTTRHPCRLAESCRPPAAPKMQLWPLRQQAW